MENDPELTPTTRLGFLGALTRHAAQAVPLPDLAQPVETAPDLPPPGTLIEPYLADDAFLEDVEGAVEPGLHLGGSGRAASSSRSTRSAC